MNKQRKVLITITYNEMGVIIDTKTEELGSSAQLGTDCISRQAAIETVMECYDNDELFEVYEDKLRELPPAFATDINVGDKDTISRKAAIDAVNCVMIMKGIRSGKSVAAEAVESAKSIIADNIRQLPPAQPAIVPCNYVKACNEATMDKLTSAVLYLNVLEELKKHGYVLVDMREVER